MIEVLILNLKPGKREEFQRLYVSRSLPLLKKWKFDVVAHGPSLHDDTTYFVVRRFESLDHRQEAEDAFYNSEDWQKGPREAILALVEGYTMAVMDPSVFESL